MKNRVTTILLCGLLFLCLWNINGLSQPITFTNTANEMGIDHTYNMNFFCGGVSFCDFDNDGWDDLTLSSNNEEAIYMYKNNIDIFNNIAPQFGITDAYQSKAVLWLDYDNDGDKDLFIANHLGVNKLYKNIDNIDFQDITTASGISTDTMATVAACWADYDNDGWLDLYVTNFNKTIRNFLYHNEGDGAFTEVAEAAGVADPTQLPLAVSFLDYDNDGWQDIYIANDRLIGNTLFKNEGDGTFSDVSAISNTDLAFYAMGIAIGDYNNDGYSDIYVTNGPEGNGLLSNNGDGTFTEVAANLSVAVNKVCWGANFFDHDNDGDLDLYVAASGPAPDKKNAFFENLGDGTFSEPSGIGLDSDTSNSFGSAVGDFNNDGYYDIAVLNGLPTPFSLWESSGGSNNWIKIKLQGTMSNRDGIGSVIEVYTGSSPIMRTTHCGISYLSQNSSTEIIGVGSSSVVDSVIVKWPSGMVQKQTQLAVNQLYTIVESQVLHSNVNTGWNLVGLPLEMGDTHYLTLFPNAAPNTLFSYDGEYITADSLEAGKGYWLNLPAAETVQISGIPLNSVTVDLAEGWNLICGPWCVIPASAIEDPGGIIIPGTAHGFDGGYFPATEIEPGKGYWIKASAAGQVTISCDGL